MAILEVILRDNEGKEVGSMEVEGELADVGPLFDEVEEMLQKATDDPDAPEGEGEGGSDEGSDESEEAGAPSEG